MSLLPNCRTLRGLRIAAAPGLLAAAAGVLFFFPPAQSGFYPRCPVYTILGLQCPGCGGTRALAALLHGGWGEALHDNALVSALLPLALGYGWRCFLRRVRGESCMWPRMPVPALCGVSIAAAIFTIARNL